jgi:uncharacterized protein (UPF0335 family)
MGRRRNSATPDPKIGENGAALTDDRKRQLHGYITEIERWNAEKATIQADIGQIFNAAKDAGFDTKAMRAIIKSRKQSAPEREAFDAICAVYEHALGDFATTLLGKAMHPAGAAASH